MDDAKSTIKVFICGQRDPNDSHRILGSDTTYPALEYVNTPEGWTKTLYIGLQYEGDIDSKVDADLAAILRDIQEYLKSSAPDETLTVVFINQLYPWSEEKYRSKLFDVTANHIIIDYIFENVENNKSEDYIGEMKIMAPDGPFLSEWVK